MCAARTESGDNVLAGLPELSIRGLGDNDARALLLDHVHGPLDAAVCDQIVAESHGNPLALLELPRTWNNPAELAGGFGLPGSQPVAGKIEQSYAQRLLQLPSDTRLLVLVAAAEPLGDPVLLHRAAETLGLDMTAAQPGGGSRVAQGRGARRVRASTRPIHRLPFGDRRRTATACTTPSPKPPTLRPTQIGAPGTAPAPRRDRARKSPPSSSVRRVGRRHAAGSPPRPRSCNAPSH